MTNTQRKLDEARFFLGKMKLHDPYFDYYLSAYLNASRSTTWVMRNEYGSVNGWEDWFKGCAVTEEEKINMTQINNLRIESAKKAGVKTKFLFLEHLIADEGSYATISQAMEELVGEEIEITVYKESETIPQDEDMFLIRGTVASPNSGIDKARETIFETCEAYYNFLARHVAICTEKFGASSSAGDE